jgi:hypothetical protein
VPTLVLSAAQLFAASLPARWAPLLDALADLDDLTHGIHLPRAERCEAAAALHRRIAAHLPELVEPTPLAYRLETAETRRWFTEAALLWTRLGETSSAPLVDTIGAQVLRDFPLDLPGGEAAERVRAALPLAFGWSPEEMGRIERELGHLTSNLALKRALTAALARRLGVTATEARPSEAARVALFRQVYGKVPLRAGDVDLVMTATALFFCIPKNGTVLEVPDWEQRPAPERAAVSRFLEQLISANTAETRRFPAFGWFDPAAVDGELCRALAEEVGAPAGVVASTLATMVSVLITQKADQYLVHDAWGHTWQEALVEFEWEYALLPSLDDPLGPDSGPVLGGEGTPPLAAAFVADGEQVRLDEDVLLAFAEGEVRGRVRVATSAALAEMLADFMESKYGHFRGVPLPTSSLLTTAVVKIDLTLADLRRQVVRWTQPYRTLAVDEPSRRRLGAELLRRGVPPVGLEEAVDAAARLMWSRLATAFDETLRAEPGPVEGLRSSVLRRLALQFLLVARELDEALARRAAAPGPVHEDPARSADLFALAVARLYEHDRARSFWHLDQVARTEVGPACRCLAQALAQQAPR